MSNRDVVIIGGGVIGLSVAWRAAQRGLRVTVLERDRVGGGTSRVAAGMLAPIAETEAPERHLLDIRMRSAALYPEFVADLALQTGIDPGYLRCGTLFVARDADEAEELLREYELRRELGLGVQRLTPSAARELEPALAPTVRLALLFEDDHAIDPRRLTAALAEGVVRAGGELREQRDAARVLVEDQRVAGVELRSGERLHCEQVVVAAGAWSGQLDGLGDGAGAAIRPVKGQIVAMHDPSGPGLLTRTLRMLGGYLVPRGDGRYVLGATVEERGFDTTVTAGAVFELLREAIELVPAVSELVIDELMAGVRPGTSDNAPLLGPGALEGLHWATGHYRNGILLAPVTAEIVVDGLVGVKAGV